MIKVKTVALRNLRKKLKISQPDFAKSIGISARTYCSYESGEEEQFLKMNLKCLLNICNLYGVPLNYFFEIDDANFESSSNKEIVEMYAMLKHQFIEYQKEADQEINNLRSEINKYKSNI